MASSRTLHGRQKIKTDTAKITAENVVYELQKAVTIHERNTFEEEYLWRYYKGETPIWLKEKTYRTDINNIISENRAMQIVEFYQGYIFGEPIQYVRRGRDESLNDEIEWLNSAMTDNGKQADDDMLAEYMLVLGVCPRLILPDKDCTFREYALDPRYAFNVYYNGIDEYPVMGVKYITKEDGTRVYSVYTDDMMYTVEASSVIASERHLLGRVPMVEYCLNNVRMGVFEPVISILDAIDCIDSNRVDDIEQFVDSILCTIGAEISDETYGLIREYGTMSLPNGADAKYITSALSQNGVQTLKGDLLSAITEITGMPNRNGGTSTSDTGSAVLLRDGWEVADAKSKRIERQYKSADRVVLGMISHIAGIMANVHFRPGDVDIRFTRRNYENIATKSQVLITMLNCDKIAPELAFMASGLFADPALAYQMSKEYIEEYMEGNNDRQITTEPGTAGTTEGSTRTEGAESKGAEE